MFLDKTQYYDLKDPNFGWRGRYRILKQESESGLVLVENLGTNSRQYVSSCRLRVSKCEQFALKFGRK